MLIRGQTIWHRFWKRESGVVSVELSIVFIPFIITILFIAELCRIAYLSSTLDLLLAESGHIASISKSASNYQKFFTQEMNERVRQKPLFSRGTSVNASIIYCSSIDDLISQNYRDCISGPPDGMPLAVYSVHIDYKPLFFVFPRKFAIGKLSRRIALVQEFQDSAY